MSHDPSEIIIIYWFGAQETFQININAENSCAFCGYIFFRLLWWIQSSKEQHLFEIEMFCNIIKIFTVTIDHFNATLLNRSINLLNTYVNVNLIKCSLLVEWPAQLNPSSWILSHLQETAKNTSLPSLFDPLTLALSILILFYLFFFFLLKKHFTL